MRQFIFALLSQLLLLTQVWAQNPATNFWYYQYGEGLNFSSGNPVLLNDGMIGSAEGTAAISDSSGNLLFYSEGVTLWDRNHNPMPNGTGLLGDQSTSQSVLIVPRPQNSQEFIVFTNAQTCGPAGLRYSVVNMGLNAGLGDVVTGQKNLPLMAPSLEKIAAVHHCNGEDVWVTAIHALTGEFYSWLVTKDGLCNCPVISLSGPRHDQGFGCMKFSNNGQRLVVVESDGACNGNRIHTDLYAFDNNIGGITHLVTIDTAIGNTSGSGGRFFGASFSPNNQLLYLSTGFSKYNGSAGISQTTAVVQYDLSATNIEGSAVILHDDAVSTGGCGSPMGSLQLGPDGKIYVGNNCLDGTGMDVIQNPDVQGLGCNYTRGGVPGAAGSGYGITNFIESYFGQGVTSPCVAVLDTLMCNWVTQVHCPVVSVEEEKQGSLEVYPNPFSMNAEVVFSNPVHEEFELSIYDIQGNLVRQHSGLNSGTVMLQRDGLEVGMYLVVVRSRSGLELQEKVLVMD